MNWIEFVKKISIEKNIKFNEALKVASVLYHKEKGTIPKKKVKKNIDDKKLTGKFILKHLKRLVDSGKIYKGQKKKDIINVLKSI
tara:strand:+ start:885 stop:1139 length:255 start_codon:yes stop_codon:yes gene_type:complete